jgi:hypothetical protein
VSPFRPFLLPQPRVCSRNRRLRPSPAPRDANISTALSTLRILPVATGVSGQRTPRHSFTPIFEGSLVYPDPRGATRLPRSSRGHCSFVFITLQIPFLVTPLFSHPYKTAGCAVLGRISGTPGVSPLRHSPSMPSSPLRPLCSCLPRPGRGGKSHVFSSLPPLCRSLRSFLHSLPLFSIACSLFYENTGGGGGCSGYSRRSDVQTFRRSGAPSASRSGLWTLGGSRRRLPCRRPHYGTPGVSPS